MNLKDKLTLLQLKGIAVQLENLDYDDLIEGLELLKADYAELDDDRYFKVVYAITNCMYELQKIYDKKED